MCVLKLRYRSFSLLLSSYCLLIFSVASDRKYNCFSFQLLCLCLHSALPNPVLDVLNRSREELKYCLLRFLLVCFTHYIYFV